MTPNELRLHLDALYGIKPWPAIHYVDAETYGNVCQEIFDWKISKELYELIPGAGFSVSIFLGLNHGIKFKNIELRIHGHQVEPRTAAGSLD